MIQKISFWSVWGFVLAGIAFFLVSSGDWSWVLLVYIPLLLSIVITTYVAMLRKTKKCWLINLFTESISFMLALGLLFFIDDLFDYDGGGMFPGLAYLTEGVYSLLAAIVFEISLFASLVICMAQKKRGLSIIGIIMAQIILIGAFSLGLV